MTSEIFGTHFDPHTSVHEFAAGDYSGNCVVQHQVDAALQHIQIPLPVAYGQAWLFADLDRDGNVELILQRGDSGMGGGFQIVADLPAPSGSGGATAAGDFDADGDGLGEFVMNFYPNCRVIGWDPTLGEFAAVWSWQPPTTGTLALRIQPRPSGGVTIGFELPNPATGTCTSIFDSSGRLVRSIASGAQAAGEHSLIWDGRDATSGHANSGCFFVRLAAGLYKGSRRVLIVR